MTTRESTSYELGWSRRSFDFLRLKAMNMRWIAVPWIAGVLATVAFSQGAFAQGLSLLVNPRTGEVEIRNDSSSNVNIDGYLLTATSPRFNPGNWSSLTADNVPGWSKAHSASNRLGEANLGAFSTVAAGNSIDLGAVYLPFLPAQIALPEPTFKFEYHVNGGTTIVGDVVFAPQNNVVLVVNPSDGSAALQNQSNFDVTIDGYFVTSPTAQALSPSGWASWSDSGAAGIGWAESAGQPNRLGELTLVGSKLLPANGQPVPLGSPVNPAMLQSAKDLVLEYHVVGGGTLRGGVLVAAGVAPPNLEGDYNGDGRVDAADYTVWRNNLGDATEADINFNGDGGGIGSSDYTWWKRRFGNTSSGTGGVAVGSGATVPEPAAWWSAFAGLVCLSFHAVRSQGARRN